MDISKLSDLGKVGGVPGIALGAVVLVIAGVLAATDAVPPTWRGPLMVLVVVGMIGLGALALAGWMRGNRADAQVPGAEGNGAVTRTRHVSPTEAQTASTEGDRSAARNEDASRSGGRQDATTRGKDSPATNIRR